MSDLKDIISKNLVALRTKAHLTQLQLAEMLNYSDKAVSKWERGEAVPDIRVLVRIAEIYGVTLDDIVKDGSVTPHVLPKKKINGRRIFITALSAVLVWFVATGLFTLFYFIEATASHAYLVFVVAPLPTSVVLTVFSAKWGNRITNAVSSSLILWSCVLIFHIFVLAFSTFTQIYLLYAVAAVFELLIIMWFTFRWYSAHKGKKRKRKGAEADDKKGEE
ncbi:MAG: helix-turn-helix domain-containing protein [Clostridia bacterium]|nr:helix-turn-helix domain-containing protein [Clostridia bacterium]